MKNNSNAFCVMVLLLLIPGGSIAHAGVPNFQGLGDLPGGPFKSEAYDVSADGMTVVGSSWTLPGSKSAFRWTAIEGLVDLGGDTTRASAVSADGSHIVGTMYISYVVDDRQYSHYEAFLWTNSSGAVGLRDLPMEDNDPRSHARAVSALGDVVVGIFDTAQSVAYGSEAFRWRSGSDMVGLGDFPGKDFWSASRGVSADGTVIVGFGMNSTGYEAFRWTETDGMVGLGDFDGGEHYSLANGISGDGSTIVGFGYPGTDTRAFRWTKGDGMVDLGDPLGVLFDYHAYDASYDGTVIVGSVQDGPYEAVTAFVWDADHGIRSLQVLLENDCGLDLTGWTLTSARGVSDDGKTIVGYGINPDGNTEAWVATVPEPATLGMLALGGLAVLRRRRRC